MMDLAPALTVAESDVLADCESKIARGLKTFIEVGEALATIRDNRLYRLTHATFEEYCEGKWGLSRYYAYRLLDAAEVQATLLTMGNKPPEILPANERQSRPLSNLLPHPAATPEERTKAKEAIRETWDQVIKTAPQNPDGTPRITGAHVEQVVRDRAEREPEQQTSPRRAPARSPLPEAMRKATYQLTKDTERLVRLAGDDRFPRNAEQVARMVRNDLLRAAEHLAEVLSRLPKESN